MKLKLISVLVFLFILIANTYAINYPEPFIVGDRDDVYIVRSSSETSDFFAMISVDLAQNLQSELSENINITPGPVNWSDTRGHVV